MTVNVTIIGLGRIGASLGLALGRHPDLVHRLGSDREPSAMRDAERIKAVDEILGNARTAVRQADVVLLCLPADQTLEMLDIIANDLKEGAVVMDTAPLKQRTSKSAADWLPPGRFYIGLIPAINPDFLDRPETDPDAELFERGLMLVVYPPGTSEEAARVAADIITLSGATPLFADLAEADGLAAWAHLLPQLAGNALLAATTGQPGWREARKIAGRPYAAATAAHEQAAALASAAVGNRENTVRVLDAYIAALQAMRRAVEAGDEPGLRKQLEKAQQAREKWLNERHTADWLLIDSRKAEIPSLTDHLQQMVMGGLKRKKKKDE